MVVGEYGAVVVVEDVQVSSRDPRTGPCTDLGMEGGWMGKELEVQWVVQSAWIVVFRDAATKVQLLAASAPMFELACVT